MSKDLKGKRASLWHAYTALQEQGKDKENAVAKGQLKVRNVAVFMNYGIIVFLLQNYGHEFGCILAHPVCVVNVTCI